MTGRTAPSSPLYSFGSFREKGRSEHRSSVAKRRARLSTSAYLLSSYRQRSARLRSARQLSSARLGSAQLGWAHTLAILRICLPAKHARNPAEERASKMMRWTSSPFPGPQVVPFFDKKLHTNQATAFWNTSFATQSQPLTDFVSSRRLNF